MITTKSEEKICNVFEARGPHGRGYFYITNSGVYFESLKSGQVLDLPFNIIGRYGVSKNHKFRIDWMQGTTKFYYEITIKSVKQIFAAYQKANKEYAESASELTALKITYTNNLKKI